MIRTLYILFFIVIANTVLSQQPFTLPLHKGWTFKEVSAKQWLPATVPGTVHTDLMKNKRIPDPYYRDNETKVQWVSQKDWQYQTTLTVAQQQLSTKYLELVFEGLDTYADVYLNDQLILKADNMFRTWRVDVKPLLKPGKNKLFLQFSSADRKVDSLAKAALPLVRPSENNRHYARKAQYHFGWDWGPKLTTAGIWRKVSLQGSNEKQIEDDAWKSKLVNKIALVQNRDSVGSSFYFTVNDEPVFMKGANWIPADMFLPRLTKAKYRQLLVAAKEANINMLRVWGGGIYEDDAFYDLCDSLGIMVWQDFMFAGAMYPGDEAFVESVKQEVIDNIKRLRHHPSIVAWCGNNEIDEAWHNWGWQKQFNLSAQDSARIWNDYTKLFREMIPQLVQQYDGTRPYISTSPMHGWGRKQSMTEGDSHYWGVWWGLEPIEKYKEKVPRFMSEYGMQAMPNWETITKFSLPQDWDTASVVMKVHQKNIGGYDKLAAYLKQNGYAPKTFRAFANATQEVQSKALATAITAHMDAAPYCMGTLFWQFNDCWPVTSWSVIDYYGGKKKGYYKVKELYKREVKKDKLPAEKRH
jgi:beta-mannosidase